MSAHPLSFVSIEITIRRFRYSVITIFPLVLWSNILIVIIMELSTHIQSMLFPLCLHILLTGSLLTLVIQRHSLFYLQEYATEQYRYRQVAKKYHSYMFLSTILLPLLTIVCCISLFHISLDSAFHHDGIANCPSSYLQALQTLNIGGQSLVILYSFTLLAILICTCMSNYLAAILASYYISI